MEKACWRLTLECSQGHVQDTDYCVPSDWSCVTLWPETPTTNATYDLMWQKPGTDTISGGSDRMLSMDFSWHGCPLLSILSIINQTTTNKMPSICHPPDFRAWNIRQLWLSLHNATRSPPLQHWWFLPVDKMHVWDTRRSHMLAQANCLWKESLSSFNECYTPKIDWCQQQETTTNFHETRAHKAGKFKGRIQTLPSHSTYS